MQLEELIGFTVPEWMLDKMKIQMQAMRTDLSRPSKLIYDAAAFIGLQVINRFSCDKRTNYIDCLMLDDVYAFLCVMVR